MDAKWTIGIGPDAPVTAAARDVLARRLALVTYYAPLAAWHSDDTPQHVHRLRVAIRRALAALRAFADALPRRRRRWIERRLNELRRAANDARDYDVRLLRLDAERTGDETSRDPLREHLLGCRQRAQHSIIDAHDRLKQRGFERRVARLLDKVRWRGDAAMEPSFRAAGRQVLSPLVDRVIHASHRLKRVEDLHRLRIEGKRLRYAIEIFASAFPDSFPEQVYPVIGKLQRRLGELNDHATAIEDYRDWLGSGDGALDEEILQRLLNAEEKQLARSAKRARRWWNAQRARRLQEQFEGFLQPCNALATAGSSRPFLTMPRL